MAEEPWSWARRNAYDWVEWGVAHDWSGRAILGLLREIGFGYRPTDLYADIREIKQIGINERYVRALQPHEVVPRSWMANKPEDIWHVGVPYKAVGYIEYWEPGEIEPTSKYVTIGFPREMTEEEIRNYVMTEVPWGPYEIEIEDFIHIGTMHLKGAPY